MSTFKPTNSLEIKLREMITDKNTLSWSFYTPLAAAELWIIIQHHPELDGSDEVAPKGENPGVCIMQGEKASFIGIYTSPDRVEAVFEQWKLSRAEWTCVSARGYQLLRYLMTFDADLWMNAGLKDCQYHLDPGMVEILLSRPEPIYEKKPDRMVVLNTNMDPVKYLGPLREFLETQPNVRAVWIFGDERAEPLSEGHEAFVLQLLMEDSEDESLMDQVKLMAKALTPVEHEWEVALMMADDRSLRNLSKQKRPFYEGRDFLKKKRHQ